MKRLVLAAAFLLVAVTGCSKSSDPQTTPDASPSTPSASDRATRTSQPATTTPSRMSSPTFTRTTRAAPTPRATSTAAVTPTSTKPPIYTCHYEEGDAPCSAAEYAENKKAWAQYQAENNGGATSSSSVARDGDGFALGGPAYPALSTKPSATECSAYRSALIAWADYQNRHRPAGSQSSLPTSGDVQNLWFTCKLDYYSE